jgi:hypothetical protein
MPWYLQHPETERTIGMRQLREHQRNLWLVNQGLAPEPRRDDDDDREENYRTLVVETTIARRAYWI